MGSLIETHCNVILIDLLFLQLMYTALKQTMEYWHCLFLNTDSLAAQNML